MFMRVAEVLQGRLGALDQDFAVAALVVHLVVGLGGGGALFHQAFDAAATAVVAILDSLGGRASTMIGPDTAVCRNCLQDMFDPKGRRWRYAFTSCARNS